MRWCSTELQATLSESTQERKRSKNLTSGKEFKVIRLPEFDRDLKRLKKKYRTLSDDLENFQKALILAHSNPDIGLRIIDSNPIQGVPGGAGNVFIAKKFTCRALKGKGSRSGIRVVYQMDEGFLKLIYIEVFHKSEKPLPDIDRIRRLLNSPE